MTTTLQLRTLPEIRAWALTKDHDEEVGIPEDSSACPLAQCHNELDKVITRQDAWFFDCDYVYRGDDYHNGQDLGIDNALSMVMEIVDVYQGPITARALLTILDRVEAEYAQ